MITILERKDFEVDSTKHIRITVYTNVDGNAVLCVIDKDKLLHDLLIGLFVEFVPFIIKSIHYTARISETSAPTLTVVPNQSFRIVKTREEAGSIHTRVCIIPARKD